MRYDLAIEGGTLVSGTGLEKQNLYIQEGVVANVTTDRLEARQHCDASGLVGPPGDDRWPCPFSSSGRQQS